MGMPQHIADGLDRAAGAEQARRERVTEQIDPLPAVPRSQAGSAGGPLNDRGQVVVRPEWLIGGQMPDKDVAAVGRLWRR
jgi:hypothetical protein